MKQRIVITRTLPILPEHGLVYAKYFAEQVAGGIGIEWQCDGSRITFTGGGLSTGVKGTLAVQGATFTLDVELPLLLAAMGDTIEAEIVTRFDAIEQMALEQAKKAGGAG